jgi:hypothetical protein
MAVPDKIPGGAYLPVPDPTALTATAVNLAKEDLRRELANQRELMSERIARLEAILHDLDERLKDDTSVSNARLRSDIKDSVENLQHLHEERFTAIQQQFDERDVRGEQEKKASKEALDAALLAQKESVSQQNDANTTAATKTETNFTKQIDLVGTQINALDKSLADRISELKERIDRGEGSTAGGANAITERRLNTGQVFAALSVFVGFIIIAISLYAALHK